MTPPRRLPNGAEPVTVLCEGVIAAAERLRHSARQAARLTARSPGLNVESLRHAAAASVVISHNCAVLLHVLANERTDRTAESMDRAAKTTERSRDRWLATARHLDQVTSDMRGYIAADATDARDLALWTGRLAYVDPNWTLASGPHQAARGAGDLARGPGEIERVVAAVHHVSDALQLLAAAHQQQAWLGSRARRFLVATRSLPEDYDVARPYAPATRARAALVISAYESAHAAAMQTRVRCADVASAVGATSQVLNFVAAVSAERADASGKHDHRPVGEAITSEPPGFSGPLERELDNLRVTDTEQLRRAVELDRAAEQLLIDACLDPQLQARETSHEGAAPAATQYAITKRRIVLAAGYGRQQDLEYEQPEREP